MTSASIILLPQPRNLVPEQGAITLKNHHHLKIFDEADAFPRIAERIRHDLRRLLRIDAAIVATGIDKSATSPIILRRDAAQRPQGYRLHVTPRHVLLEFADEAGAFYAAATLRQLVRQFRQSLPACLIEDWPDFPSRGVMLDISRDKVPTMDTLFQLVDELAEWKINHFELYMEHTFAYAAHRDVWAHASPMTGEEIRELDAHCRARHVELVPNQNSFGHMHRWLELPRYRDLAECPDGFTYPWGVRREGPYSLNPLDPRSIALVGELFAELLPHFTSRRFNVGCDETFDLGQGRSRETCERIGKGRVYFDFLMRIHQLVLQHGHTMHFWGDIILHHPQLIPELPRDVVPLVWGYEADHPFDSQCAQFAATGLSFYVCPGTSTWNSIVGRTDNALMNLRNAAKHGLAHGAAGYLVTDWGDNGHWQPYAVSLLPFAAGAGCAWCLETNRDADLAAQLDVHVFRDSAGVMGQLVHDLGCAYRETGHSIFNESPLFRLLFNDDLGTLLAAIPDDALRRARGRIAEVIKNLDRAAMDRQDAELIANELGVAAHMAEHACARGSALSDGALSDAQGQELATDLRGIVEDYRRQWLARNRPGGLSDSTRRLEHRVASYTTGP